jgi:hypothetical protein
MPPVLAKVLAQQMFTKVDGDGPFGGSGALKVWRSFLTDQYAVVRPEAP